MTVAFALTAEPAVALRDLFGELGDLKRIRSAGRVGSIAERRFRLAWGALVAGADVEHVMRATVAASLAAARIGDLDAAKLGDLGLGEAAIRDTLRRAFDEVGASLDRKLFEDLRAGLDDGLPARCSSRPSSTCSRRSRAPARRVPVGRGLSSSRPKTTPSIVGPSP